MSKAIRFTPLASSRSPVTWRRASPSGRTAVDLKVIGVPLSTSWLIVWAMPSLSSSPSDFTPPVPSSTLNEVESAVSSSTLWAGSSANCAVAPQRSTSMSRLWPALDAAPPLPVRTSSLPSCGPSSYVPGCIAMLRSLSLSTL